MRNDLLRDVFNLFSLFFWIEFLELNENICGLLFFLGDMRSFSRRLRRKSSNRRRYILWSLFRNRSIARVVGIINLEKLTLVLREIKRDLIHMIIEERWLRIDYMYFMLYISIIEILSVIVILHVASLFNDIF